MRLLISVTYISEDGAFGGPVSVALNQAAGLAEAGHEVTVLAGWDGRARPKAPGFDLVLLKSKPFAGMGFVATSTRSLGSWLRRNLRKFDVVHVHSGRHLFDLAVATAARRMGRPYVVQPHGMILPSSRPPILILDSFVVRPMLRHASTVLALTDAEERSLRRLEPEASVRRIRNGIRPIQLATSPRRSEVLFLARLHPRKQVLVFAEMARLLSRRNRTVQFAVVGPDEGDLAALRSFMSTNPDVPLRYEGAIQPGEAPARLAQALVFVLPSRGEVFPVTVLEALSVGTATVITDDCGIAQELADHNAALVSEGSPEDLAQRVESLLLNPSLLESTTASGHASVRALYGIEAVVSSLLRFYEDAVGSRGVLWMTNTAAPYRIPVWESLARRLPVEVMLLEPDQRLARDDNNRGPEWEARSRTNLIFAVSWLKTAVLKRGEARYYFGWLRHAHLRNKRAVVLGGWESPVYWMALLRAKRARVRTVGFYESHLGSQGNTRGPISWLRRRYFATLDAVVTPGPAATEAVMQMGVARSRIHEGFNAVDVTHIREVVQSTRPAQQGDHRLRIIYVGQLIPRKNVGALIGALTTLPNASLTIVGVGPLRAQLEQQVVTTLPNPDRVTFVGYIPGQDVAKRMLEHDVLVLPSLSEVWGLVVNEALACGLHVVVSTRAGVTRSVEKHAGVIVSDPDTMSLVSALRSLPDPVGRIPDPEILQQTPARFSEVFERAILSENEL
ncbi:glycosyltransferase [Curtobacterium sp. MCLR17_055]|uniref:glycosyltransferase n=1 Tax=Curtobacterium sp. MCLR17_055 TaxID=2175633 RepID=UPI000DA7B54F|nr:glycosyltransferase [Curtobacterium sp. MCLR17_055]PZE28540.1 hypothetical protein DEJ09_10990 [Curtobacterium sp. MCLR17_055]